MKTKKTVPTKETNPAQGESRIAPAAPEPIATERPEPRPSRIGLALLGVGIIYACAPAATKEKVSTLVRDSFPDAWEQYIREQCRRGTVTEWGFMSFVFEVLWKREHPLIAWESRSEREKRRFYLAKRVEYGIASMGEEQELAVFERFG